MKRRFLEALLFSGLLTLLPLIPVMLLRQEPRPDKSDFSTVKNEPVENVPAPKDCYYILREQTGEVQAIPVHDYILGAVAAEMPVTFEDEALKAQAVAAHTYAERQCLASAGREDLHGADFSDDPAKYQAFLTEDELRERWGTHFDVYYTRLSTLVAGVVENVLFYEDEPILAAFHAVSAGQTDAAETVWGSDLPYLQPVDCHADKAAPSYEETASFSPDETGDRLRSSHPALDLDIEPEEWFGEPVTSEAGTVLSLPVTDGLFTGQEIRALFGLRSAAFTVQYEKGRFVFTTHGFGHNVGMSQYGANEMARSGADHKEILAYYYPDTTLKRKE
jgi:stage II sporulation protein D